MNPNIPLSQSTSERSRSERAVDESAHLAKISRHFDLYADRYALKYGATQPEHLFEHEKRVRLALVKEWIDGYARRRPAGELLDVGCGEGQLIRSILVDHLQWRATGVDVSARMLQCAAENCERAALSDRISWQSVPLTESPGSYDAVVSLGVVGYQRDQPEFLRSLAARVRPEGLLIFTFGNAQSYLRRLRSAGQSLRSALKQRESSVRYDAMHIQDVDRCLLPFGLQRIDTRWLCFGLGLPRSSREVQLSRWCESRWGRSARACRIAQVALVCCQAARVKKCRMTKYPMTKGMSNDEIPSDEGNDEF